MTTVERTPTAADLACIICRKPGPDLDIDHVINRGAGGSKERDVPANKVPLCRPCHLAKTVGTIKTWVKDGVYHWRKADSDLVFNIPVKISARYGCLIPCDGADDTDGHSLASVQPSAPSQAGEGTPPQGTPLVQIASVPSLVFAGPGPIICTDVGAQPGPAHMNAEGADLSSNAAPLTPSAFSLDSDWTALDDDTLQSLYDEGEQRQQEGYLLKCKAVWTYRERHVQVWGDSWTDQAIERFGCSRRYAYSYANLWQIYVTSDTYLREGMAALTDSRSLMQTIGRATVEEGAKLLESAVAHVAEFAQPPSVKALVGSEPPERERHTCSCGNEHWIILDSGLKE